jgi:hypothetical protein
MSAPGLTIITLSIQYKPLGPDNLPGVGVLVVSLDHISDARGVIHCKCISMSKWESAGSAIECHAVERNDEKARYLQLQLSRVFACMQAAEPL